MGCYILLIWLASEVVAIGDEIDVTILKFDKDKNRVSLGLKQLDQDPWASLVNRFPVDSKIKGKVTNITDYGCFVEIADGIEGLVHVSEMDWTNKNIHPSKVVQLGDQVEVMVLDVDAERRRISLGIKQCIDNPWSSFSSKYKKGDKVIGKIKSITDFGLFIGLEGNIDGLIHLSDVSWDEDDAAVAKEFKKGDEVEALILAVDSERERISLGIKQLSEDPWGHFLVDTPKGQICSGKVVAVTPSNVEVELADGVIGNLAVNDISVEKVDDATTRFSVGDAVEAKVITADRKARTIKLSIRAIEADEQAKVMKQYTKGKVDSSVKATLGDILKEQMGNGGFTDESK